MKRVAPLSLLLAVLAALLFFAQPAAAADWALSFGMSAQYARINATTVDSTGNTYIAGYFTNYSQPLGSTTLIRIGGGPNAFVAKINDAGTVLWARNYGGSTSSYGSAGATSQAIAVDASDNVYLSGNTDVPLTTPSVPGAAGPFVIKLDDAGTTLWAKVLGGTSVQNTKTTGIAVDGTGGVYLSGYSGNGTNPSILGETVRGVQDAFALKLDAADGTTIWAKNYGGSGATTRANAIAVDTWGSVYLAGHFHSANLTYPALTRIGGADAFALKLDPSNGSPDWARNYGGSGAGAYANAIAVDASGNVYLGGNFDSANLTTPALSLNGTGDVFAFKLDSVGSVSGTGAWARNYGGSVGAIATATGIAVDASGNVYLGGDFRSANLTTPALSKIGSTDAFALKLDSLGATTWARNYGGGGVDPWGYRVSANAFAIAVDASGNVHLGGSFDNGNLTSPALTFTPNGRTDALILKQTTVLPVVNSLSTASGGVSGGTVVTLSGYSLSGATAVNFGANPGTSLTVNSATSITVTVPASTTGFGAVDVTVTTPSGTGGIGNGLFAYAGAPSQLAAPTVTLTGNVASVSFTAPADNGSAITGYTVVSNPAGGTDSNAGSTALSHTVTGLTYGTAYTFTVTATNAIGTSVASPASGAVTPFTIPDAPTSVSAVAGSAQATVSFSAPAFNGGGIASYTVVSNPAGGTDSNAGSAALSHTVTGLASGISYTFTVVASNAAGTSVASAPSNAVTPSAPLVSTPTIPPLPITVPGVTALPPIANMAAGEGPAFLADMVAMLSSALGQPLQPIGQNALGTVTLSGFNGGKLAFVPSNYQGSGDPRANGIYPLGDGRYQIVRNGQSLVITPALVSLDQLLALLPGVVVRQADNGVLIATFNGLIYAVQPGVQVQTDSATGSAQLVMGADGNWHFIDAQGNHQILYPAFADVTALHNALLGLDGNATLSIQLDGTATIVFQGQRYTLVPDPTLAGVPTERLGQSVWQEGAGQGGTARYRMVNNQPLGTAQGLTVKP